MIHECEGCKFFDPWLNVCSDEIIFIDYDTKETVCRYHDKAIPASNFREKE